MSVYFVFTMCGMFTNFEMVWNGYLMDMTFVLWPFYDPLLAKKICICALLHNLF